MPAHAGALMKENGERADSLRSADLPQVLDKHSARKRQGPRDRKIREKRSCSLRSYLLKVHDFALSATGESPCRHGKSIKKEASLAIQLRSPGRSLPAGGAGEMRLRGRAWCRR